MKQIVDPEFRQYRKCTHCGKNKLRESFVGTRCNDCKPTEKKCSRCEILKPLIDFIKRNTSPDGRSTECKKCYSRRIKAKKETERTSIVVRNPYRKGSVAWEIYQFFGQHQLKLTQEEVELICRELKEAESKLSTLDKILARYKVGIDDYLPVHENSTKKAVIQYELGDKEYLNPIGRFESLAEASIAIRGDKFGMGSISQSCRNGGMGLKYRWRYEEIEE